MEYVARTLACEYSHVPGIDIKENMVRLFNDVMNHQNPIHCDADEEIKKIRCLESEPGFMT
jgi:hypothetical protein